MQQSKTIKRKIVCFKQFIGRYTSVIIITLIGIPFYPKIESFFIKKIAVPFLLFEEGTVFLNIWFFAIIFIIILGFIFKVSLKTLHNSKQLTLSIILLIGYFYYRMVDCPPFCFLSTTFYPSIKYWDIIPLYSLSYIISCSYIAIKKRTPRVNKEGFIYDHPLKDQKDTLGRKEFAEQLADRIAKTSSNDSAFAMGIVGNWGSGKTSFWKLIKRRLEELEGYDQRIIFEYCPFQNHGAENIVKDFFASLGKALQPYDSSFNRQLEKYSQLLIEAGNSDINTWLKPLRLLFFPMRTVKDEYDKINNKLKLIEKQIIIFIDDLDRLDKSEVLEIIRLIRNTANFANAVFVAAYDKGYIIKAIESFNEYNKEDFLEKIFQLEVPLPSYEHDKIKEELKSKIYHILKEEDKKIFEKLFPDIDTQFFLDGETSPIVKSLTTVRDVIRFSNSFIETYSILKDDTYFPHLFYTELLKVKFLGVYQHVFDGTYQLLDIEESNKGVGASDQVYVLRKGEDANPGFIETYLEKNSDQYFLRNYKIKTAIQILEKLFNKEINSDIGVNVPSSFLRYPFNRLAYGNLSTIAFSKARKNGYDSLIQEIKNAIIEPSISVQELEKHLFRLQHFDNKTDFEIVFKSWVYYCRKQHNRSKIHEIASFCYLVASMPEGQTLNRIYKQDITSFKTLIHNILDEGKFPFTFELIFIRIAIVENNGDSQFPFSNTELKDLFASKVEQFVNDQESSYEKSINLLYGFKTDKYFDHGVTEEAIKICFEIFIERGREFFEYSVVESDGKYSIKENIIILLPIESLKKIVEQKNSKSTEDEKFISFLDDLIKTTDSKVSQNPFKN